MGGRAIMEYGFEPSRLSKREYEELVLEVEVHLMRVCSPDDYRLLPAYKSKTDFGDCDILIKNEVKFDRYKFIEEICGYKPIHNDKVYSFPYKGFQFDFIFMPSSIFEAALSYYSWNDLGNLQGRSFHSLGIVYGHSGLNFVIRGENFDQNPLNTYIYKTALLSKDTKEIFEFGGYDYQKFVDGFDTLEEIFHYAASGRFFNAEKFRYENLNNPNRTRNRKRATYRLFLEWLELHKHEYPQFEFNSDKRVYIPMLMERFPKLKDDFAVAKEAYERHELVHSKFNGNLVKEWTGLVDKELGVAIKHFKGLFPDFEGFVYSTSADEIKQSFFSSLKPPEGYDSWEQFGKFPPG